MKLTMIPAALSLALAGSLAGSSAFAQQAPASPSPDQQPPAPISRPYHDGHHAPSPQKQAAMLSRRLNLTTDQTARLEPILADRDQKVAALRANTSLTPQDMHQQMHALQQQEMTQLSAVLTPEQLDQLKSMRHGRHGQFRGQGQPPQPTPGL